MGLGLTMNVSILDALKVKERGDCELEMRKKGGVGVVKQCELLRLCPLGLEGLGRSLLALFNFTKVLTAYSFWPEEEEASPCQPLSVPFDTQSTPEF